MFDLNDIPQESDDLVKFLFNTLVRSKKINISYIDKSDVMRNVHKLTSDHVKKDIKYHPDSPDKEAFEIVLPIVDERVLYKNKNVLPPSGYFSKMRSEVIKKPMGILITELISYESHMNQSDNRFLKDRFNFNETGYFLFDYKENVYVQVPGNQIEQCEFQMQKNGVQLEDLEIENPYVYEYLRRKNVLQESLGNLKSLYFRQNEKLFDMKNSKKNNGVDRQSVVKRFEAWYEYLNTEFPHWLILKFIFSQVNEKEFYTLKNIAGILLGELKKSLEDMDSIIADFETIDSYSEEWPKYKNIKVLDGKLRMLLGERIEGSESKSEYIDMKDNNGNRILIESFIQIEKRNMLQKEKITCEEIEQEIKEKLEK